MSPAGPPVVVITGGAGALGVALEQEFLAFDWQVHAFRHEDLDVCETADPGGVQRVLSPLQRIDLLVCAAGIRRDAAFRALPEADWDRVLDTNLKGVWRCVQAVIPVMLRQGHGHIVTIGSGSGRHGAAGQSAYAAAKAGLSGLTQSLAAELGPANIRVNLVLPGWMRTPFTRDLAEEHHVSAQSRLHLGRFNTPPQTASFIRFLHGMLHTSGQTFQLDSRPGAS